MISTRYLDQQGGDELVIEVQPSRTTAAVEATEHDVPRLGQPTSEEASESARKAQADSCCDPDCSPDTCR